MLLTSLVFLRTYPRSLLALAHCTLTSLFHVRLSVISDNKILLGTDNFKLRAGHMIDKDGGFKSPSDGLRFAFAVVKF